MSFGFDCCCCCPCKNYIITLNQKIVDAIAPFAYYINPGFYGADFWGQGNVTEIKGDNPNPGIPLGSYCIWQSSVGINTPTSPVYLVLMHNIQRDTWYLFMGSAVQNPFPNITLFVNSQTVYVQTVNSNNFDCEGPINFSSYASVECACCECDPHQYPSTVQAIITGYTDHVYQSFLCRDDAPGQPAGNCNLTVKGNNTDYWSIFNNTYDLALGGFGSTWSTRIFNVPIKTTAICPNHNCSPDVTSYFYATVYTGITISTIDCVCQIGGFFLWFLYTGLNETGGSGGNGGFVCPGQKFIDCSNGPPGFNCNGQDVAGKLQTVNMSAPNL